MLANSASPSNTSSSNWILGAELTTVADGATAKNSHAHTHASTTGRTVNDHHNQSHTIASHSDTTGTGAELNTLTGGGETTLHSHAAGGGFSSRVRVTKNNAQSISNNSATKIQFDDEVFDGDAEFASNRFTAKATGYYWVTWNVRSGVDQSGANDYEWTSYLYKQGSLYQAGFEHDAENVTAVTLNSGGTALVQLNINQYLEIFLLQTNDSSASISTFAGTGYNQLLANSASPSNTSSSNWILVAELLEILWALFLVTLTLTLIPTSQPQGEQLMTTTHNPMI